MQRISFIINPIAGTRAKKNISDFILQELDKEKYVPEFRTTEYAGHAHELARQAAADGVDVVVAVGGDGTVNEVASALVNTESVFAVIPCGSGNGLARHQHIPINIKGAIRVINEGKVRPLDYGTMGDKPFFCTCGVGFDAFVSQKFAEGGKRGFMSYIEKTLREGVRYKSETYTIEYEDRVDRQQAFLIACANASQYGNNAYIAPEASMEDGLMDITIIKPFNTILAPQVIMQLFSKSLAGNPHVQMTQASSIRITRPTPGAVHVDGDPLMMGEVIDVKIHRHAFHMIVGKPTTNKLMIPLHTFADICMEILGRK